MAFHQVLLGQRSFAEAVEVAVHTMTLLEMAAMAVAALDQMETEPREHLERPTPVEVAAVAVLPGLLGQTVVRVGLELLF